MKRYTLNKSAVLIAIFLAVGVIYWIRLFQLQIIDDYASEAQNNTIRNKVQYPGRGLIWTATAKSLSITSLSTTLW